MFQDDNDSLQGKILRVEHALRDTKRYNIEYDNCASEVQNLVMNYVPEAKRSTFLDDLVALIRQTG